MREIKFRAWHKINKNMCTNVTTDLLDRDYLEFMQYTGIKDVNGVDIYEDDIVEVTAHCLGDIDFKGVVKFYEGCFVIDNGKDAIPLFSETSTFVVVDNIYEKLKREVA